MMIGYVIASLLLFFYSYTQVDLNLTLSRISVFQTIQKAFQHVGYFDRPLSTGIYVGILVILFALYFFAISNIQRLSERSFWKIVLALVIILIFSYPAFSYDFFNYMFTAKTVLVYHKNPYEVIPLQFAGVEPWLTFMRWTHLPSAYTPLWIFLTLPAYLLGFGYFLIILFNIKLLVAGFYLLTVWAIGKILDIVEPKRKLLGMAIFALNPLIIIESLVSSHNDIVMMSVATLAMLVYLKKKPVMSFFLLAVSVAMKLMTIFLIPAYIFRYNRRYALGLMLFGLVLVVSQREFLPWYWVWIMPFVALLPGWKNMTLMAASVSFSLLLRYAPVLYYGTYDQSVQALRNQLFWIPISFTLIGILLSRIKVLLRK